MNGQVLQTLEDDDFNYFTVSIGTSRNFVFK